VSITYNWADESKTILHSYFEGQWDWNNFHNAVISACQMISRSRHNVYVVIDALNCNGMPQSTPFPHFKQAIGQLPKNTNIVIIITRKKFVKMSVAIAIKFFQMEDLFYIVPSIKEARTILTEHTAKESLKHHLLHELTSGDHDKAINAIEHLRFHEWLMDGTLWGLDLVDADLRDANLFLADLGGASLEQADLTRVNFYMANLEDAVLWRARMSQASLVEVNLYNSNLREADLRHADLTASNLQRANLKDTNFEGANLHNAKLYETNLHLAYFDRHTTMPDGHHWTPQTDLKVFTDPGHQRFWYANQQREDETIVSRPKDWKFDADGNIIT